MPNIIEQQDLLKGLPDARLAMLLQNPAGDIPPFLVAAEAQRRQAIRQQFAGSESQESVVDTLTKQLVPQNIQAPPKAPPVIPPTPQMQGVAALQQQQQMQQPQEMRGGGMVRRYQDGGAITPTVESLAARMRGMSLEEYKRMLEAEKIARLGPGKARYPLENPTVPTSEAERAKRDFYAATEGPFSGFYSPETVYDLAQRVTGEPPPPADITEFNKSVALPDTQVGLGRDADVFNGSLAPISGEPTASPEMQQKPDETPDEYRARLEELLAAQEPSDWEKAQKYFAMAEQFLDPSKTTMQSVAGAGRAFAESASEQARAQREAELNLQKSLLEYDIGKSRSDAEARAAERARTSLTADQYADILQSRAESIRKIIDSKREQLVKLQPDPGMPIALDPQTASMISAIAEDIKADERRLSQIEGQMAALGVQAYNPPPYDTYSLTGREFSR